MGVVHGGPICPTDYIYKGPLIWKVRKPTSTEARGARSEGITDLFLPEYSNFNQTQQIGAS